MAPQVRELHPTHEFPPKIQGGKEKDGGPFSASRSRDWLRAWLA